MGATEASFILGGAQAGLSAMGAQEQNKAIQKSMDANAQEAAAQQGQAVRQAGIEEDKVVAEERAILGRLRVNAAESGTGTSGSQLALRRQATLDAQKNVDIIGGNLVNTLAAIKSGFNATNAQLEAQSRNPLLDAFAGAVQGVSTGLNIAGGIKGAGTPGAGTPGTGGAQNTLNAQGRYTR